VGRSNYLDDFSAQSLWVPGLPPHAQLNIGALAGLFTARSTSYKYLFFLSLLDSIARAKTTQLPTTQATTQAPQPPTTLSGPTPAYEPSRGAKADVPAWSAHASAQKDQPTALGDEGIDPTALGSTPLKLLSIPLKTVIINLLQFGWYPHRFFRLSYGPTDQVGKALDELDFAIDEQAITHPQTRDSLRAAIEAQFTRIRAQRFTRFVPYRLLTPFFSQELRGQPDHRKNDLIVQLARQSFATDNAPFYCFNEANDSLIIHPHWQAYFQRHYAIVRGWALLQWARYLQANNPSVPAILFKLEPPTQRSSLLPQRRYWQSVLDVAPLPCIYSGQPIDPSNFSLDHFLPWSFICHDQRWNLIPTTPEANSSKGRHLPDQNSLSDFIAHQYHGLEIYEQLHRGQRQWRNVANEYGEGLALAESELLDKEKLATAYHQKLNPLFSLAKNMGY